MESISTTFEVLKLNKSKEFKEKHLENMELISNTFEVSKLDKSKEFKEKHP